MVELAARERSDVVLIDADGCSVGMQIIAKLETLDRPVGVVLVADDGTRGSDATKVAKWGPFDQMIDAIERADERRGAWAGRQ